MVAVCSTTLQTVEIYSIIDKLLSLGLDVDSRSSYSSSTPLMYAAEGPQKRAFQMLIQKGVDPFLKDKDGSSLLHCAAQGGNTSIINELLSLGLEIDSKDLSGKTPLTIATEFNNFEGVKFLLSKEVLNQCKSTIVYKKQFETALILSWGPGSNVVFHKCPILVLMRKIYCPCSFALDSGHTKC